MSRRVQLAVVALFALVGGAWWWSSQRADTPASWQGYAEADYVKVAPTQQGLLTEVNLARGAWVEVGSPLFA